MKKYIYIIIILSFIAFTLEIVNIYFMNKISTDSIYASEINTKIKKYDEENVQLKNEVLKYSSLTMVSSRASHMGFVEAKGFISLFSPVEIAVRK